MSSETPTAAERAWWRQHHFPAESACRLGLCGTCDMPWPCPTRRLLDALDAAEADVARLRAALAPFAGFGQLVFDHLPPESVVMDSGAGDPYLTAGDFQQAHATLAGEAGAPMA